MVKMTINNQMIFKTIAGCMISNIIEISDLLSIN